MEQENEKNTEDLNIEDLEAAAGESLPDSVHPAAPIACRRSEMQSEEGTPKCVAGVR